MRTKTDLTSYDTDEKTIYVSNESHYDYSVQKGRNGFYELKLRHCSLDTFTLSGQDEWVIDSEWYFSIQDFWIIANTLKSKAQYFTSRIEGIIDKLIEFYIDRHILFENDAAIPVVRLFFRQFWDAFEVANKHDVGMFVEYTWDEKLSEDLED